MKYAPQRSQRLQPLLWLAALAIVTTVEGANAHVLLDAPNGGEVLPAGADFVVQWHVDIAHNTIGWDLEYSTNGGSSWKLIAPGLPPGNINQGAVHTYDWNVPNDASVNVRVRVKMDNTGQDYFDTSNADLEIQALDGATLYNAFCVQCHGANGDPCTSVAGCAGSDPPPDWSQGESLIDANGNMVSGENEDLYLVSKFGALPYGGNPAMEEWESFLSDPALHSVADYIDTTFIPEPSASLALASGIFWLALLRGRRPRSSSQPFG